MLTPADFKDYQRAAALHQLYWEQSMIWLQMSLGKTVITLTTIVDRMAAGLVQKTLIFGPLRVVHSVWPTEALKWSHTRHLRCSVMAGSSSDRLRAMFADADIFLINYENMNWLARELDHYYLSQGKPLPFQFVVYDEVSKVKNSTSKRMGGGKTDRRDRAGNIYKIHLTGWRTIIPHIRFATGLTGTPASNGYIDLHGQYLAVDKGVRLGEHITTYKEQYFTSDYNSWKWTPTHLGQKWIEEAISDITIKMDACDYLDMPDLNIENMLVDMPEEAYRNYKEMEKTMFTELDNGRELEVFSKSSVSNKCLQICNGSAYYAKQDNVQYEILHDAKLDALDEILEEAAGQPVLVGYSFVADAERIEKRFKKYKPVNMTKTDAKLTRSVIDKWNAGKSC